MVEVEIKGQVPFKVRFSQIPESGWFIWHGYLGVKVDGLGFYPGGGTGGQKRGCGMDVEVTPVSAVDINVYES